jgi:hypothetical protein
MPTPES